MTDPKPITSADRFRAFAQKVMSVPKAEIDRREAALRKRKAAAKAAKA